MPEKISAVVLTYNSEDNLPRCLESIKWVDEIIVVDSHSKDKTKAIVLSYNAKLFERDYDGYTRQLEYGVRLAGNNWIFVVDSDEELTEVLRKEVLDQLSNPPEDIGGYEISRKVKFLGKYILHGGWYPDYQYRLFRKDRSYPIHREIHSSYTTDSHKIRLKGNIIHYTYRNLYDYISRINIYTTYDTSNKLKELNGKKVRWYNLIINPIPVFIKMFILKGGFRDGIQGLILALFSAFYRSALYAKTWAYQNSGKYCYEKPPITNTDLIKFRKRGDND
ncbi:MAG: glycosyltransferase family 2 protein [Ignavibacteriae bacterium]|nr:glycosyltransferase family 2 protein [Ignavibacteriota bacterium]